MECQEAVLKRGFKEIDLAVAMRCQSQLRTKENDFTLRVFVKGNSERYHISDPTAMTIDTVRPQPGCSRPERQLIVNENV